MSAGRLDKCIARDSLAVWLPDYWKNLAVASVTSRVPT